MGTERDPSDGEVDAVADLLYGLAPEEFTAARNTEASKATGEVAKRVKALRKPAVAAWAVNLLVRDGQFGQAVELSAALREAQDDLDAKELMQLGRQRRELVASLARRAGELVRAKGGSLGPAAQEAVSSTINAAVMDVAAAAAVLTGRLIKPLEAGGLDGLAMSDIVAGSPPDGSTAPAAPTRDDLAERRARKAAEAAAKDAEHAAAAAKREAADLDARLAKSREHVDELNSRVEKLRAELERLDAEADEAAAAYRELARDQKAAASRAEDAAHDAERARAAVPND
jgi:DNA repair exonuclease SbcCD ATPase subunit